MKKSAKMIKENSVIIYSNFVSFITMLKRPVKMTTLPLQGNIAGVLQWFYGGVTVALRWCCYGANVVLQ
jgi:hypothetical protein